MSTTTKPPQKRSPVDPALKVTVAELNLDTRFTQMEKDVVIELLQDSRKLEGYAAAGATDEELGALFGVPAIAFAPFEALLKQSRAELALRIRRAHLAAAEKGSPESLAYLTAEYLTGRKEKGRGR